MKRWKKWKEGGQRSLLTSMPLTYNNSSHFSLHFGEKNFCGFGRKSIGPHTVLFSLHFEPKKVFSFQFLPPYFLSIFTQTTCTHEYLRPIWNNKNFIHVNTKRYFNTRKSTENNRILILCLSLRVCIHMNKSFCVFFFFLHSKFHFTWKYF